MIINDEKSEFAFAIDRAFDILGESSKKALIYHLQSQYAINIYSEDITAEKLEIALNDMLGCAAQSIMNHIQKELAAPSATSLSG